MIPGDGENSVMNALYAHTLLSDVDIVIPFIIDKKLRSIKRRFFSKIYTSIINLIFCMNLKYTNGSVIYKTNILKLINIKSQGFFYQTEILIKLVKFGYAYAEVPVKLNRKSNGFPKALHFKSLFRVFLDLNRTIFDIYFNKKNIFKD
jgi:hypothetical protein